VFFSDTFVTMVNNDEPLDSRLPRRDIVPGAALLVAQELLRTRPLRTSLDQWLFYIDGLTRALARAPAPGADDAPTLPPALLLGQGLEPPAPHLRAGRAGCALHGGCTLRPEPSTRAPGG
jgi:hypothetical protein